MTIIRMMRFRYEFFRMPSAINAIRPDSESKTNMPHSMLFHYSNWRNISMIRCLFFVNFIQEELHGTGTILAMTSHFIRTDAIELRELV